MGTLQKQLARAFTGENLPIIGKVDADSPVADKVYFYNEANKQVAILCNHQKSVSKNFDSQMEKLATKLEEKEDKIKDLEKELKWAKGKGKPKKDWKKKPPDKVQNQLVKAKQQLHKLKLQQQLKKDHKEVSLGTSKINYMDPRITVAW